MVVNPMISTLGSLNAIRIAMLSSRNRNVWRTDSESGISIPHKSQLECILGTRFTVKNSDITTNEYGIRQDNLSVLVSQNLKSV